MQYVYINAEPGCYTVGFYTPAGDWEPESDHPTAVAAAARVHYLNGGGYAAENEGGTMGTIGRPPVYTDNARVFLSTTGKARLQPGSERRAIVNKIVDAGGSMTLAELDEAFGYVVRDKVIALVRAGWVRVEP